MSRASTSPADGDHVAPRSGIDGRKRVTPSAREDRPAPDSRGTADELLAHVEEFARAVLTRLDSGRRLDLSDLIETLAAVTEGRLPMVMVQAQALTATHHAMAAQATPMAAHHATGQALEQLLATADREVVVVDQTAFTQARQAVAEVEAEQAQTSRDLEAAVLCGDVDAVLRLRTLVEVVLPNRLAQSRVTVAEEELKLVETVGPAPERRCVSAHEGVESIRARIAEAVAALAQAETDAKAATRWESLTRASRQLLQSETDRLTASVVRLRTDAERGHSERLRRLAGLPDAVTATPPPGSTAGSPVVIDVRGGGPRGARFAHVELEPPQPQIVGRPTALNKIEGLS